MDYEGPFPEDEYGKNGHKLAFSVTFIATENANL